jgi:hypothetical protein
MNRLFRRALTAWIAMIAILFGVLAPTLSHAVVPAAAQAVDFPICSAHAQAVDVKAPGLPKPAVDPAKHCAYCAGQHHAPGLLPQAQPALVVASSAYFPSLFYQAPAPLFHWTAPQSRAPPRLS